MNPYSSLDQRAFWAPSVGKRNMFDISELWTPKFEISRRRETVTFGSCFAQHFARALLARDFPWANKELPPQGLPEEDAQKYNYGIFSARTGNIYTTTLLLQWTQWALGLETPPEEVWEKEGRFYDPFRPNIEPGGFESPEEVKRSREACIEAFRRCITEAGMFVFTLGLTESWWHGQEKDYEYPMCPGTVAGEFDPEQHVFYNQRYPFILKNLVSAIKLIKQANPKIKILLTVSPVPLTATNSGNHVLVATMESKSILRAVAADAASKFAFVDYFPSYEIINSAPYRGTFFEPNMRSVNQNGVNHVMRNFFDALPADNKVKPAKKAAKKLIKKRKTAAEAEPADDDLVCEEELLAALAPEAE